MSYPEHGASYVHRPKFLDRAIAEEKENRACGGAMRADGGVAQENLQSPSAMQSPLPLLRPSESEQQYGRIRRMMGDAYSPSKQPK